MTTYFVSAEIGSNANAGTSATAPLATLQAAADLVKAGDTVEVMNGTYTGSPGGNLLQITTSGTSGSPITFEAAPGQTPVLNTSGEWNGILVQASYISIQGFTVVGDAASYTLAKALAQYSTSNANVDGNGIVVESAGGGQVPNHITIQNNTVYDEPGGGIGVIGADYVQILNNTVHDNAHWSAYGNSGISIASSVNSDTKSGVHDIISGNTSYNNTELVPFFAVGTITDGEGIILDTNTGFTGEILVQGNTTYGNSGAGIESFLTNNAVINGNTSYANLTNPLAASDGQIFINSSTNDVVTNNTTVSPPCFLAGTRIATPRGEVPVEQLVAGDTLSTNSGAAQPIVWIGTGRVLATRGRRNAATPVIVRKGAIADNVPYRDLRMTKGHSLFIDGALIPVEYLINHRTILFDDHAQEVSIYHIELAGHDVLIADGAPAESYRDDGNRWLFQNGNLGWEQEAKPPCAPVLTGGSLVDAVWRRLLERAGPRKAVPLTDEPDLHLVVGGERVDAIERREDTYVFRLTTKPRSVRLISRAAAPQELGLARDPRVLGVALRRLVLVQARRQQVIEADASTLADGFYPFEPEDGIRWTDGDATIPAELFSGMVGRGMLILHLGAATKYADEGCVRQIA
jgi:hypothetical protein